MELLAYPEKLPDGWIARLIELLKGHAYPTEEGKRREAIAQDFHLLWHLTGFAAGKVEGKKEFLGDFSGSDLVLHLENLLIPEFVMEDGKSKKVEKEPNWGVVVTACRKLHARLTGGST